MNQRRVKKDRRRSENGKNNLSKNRESEYHFDFVSLFELRPRNFTNLPCTYFIVIHSHTLLDLHSCTSTLVRAPTTLSLVKESGKKEQLEKIIHFNNPFLSFPVKTLCYKRAGQDFHGISLDLPGIAHRRPELSHRISKIRFAFLRNLYEAYQRPLFNVKYQLGLLDSPVDYARVVGFQPQSLL